MKKLDLQNDINSLLALTETARAQMGVARQVGQDAQEVISGLDAQLVKAQSKRKGAVENKTDIEKRGRAEGKRK